MKFIEFHFADFIHMDKINTFDMTLKPTCEPFYAFDKAITTELDTILVKLIDDFKDYQLKLKQLEKKTAAIFDEKIKILSNKEDATYEELQALRAALQEKDQQVTTIYDRRNHFFRELNTLFEKTHKTIAFDKSNALVFYRKNNKQIKLYELSAGEKQILVILLKVILQENRPYILLLDEPEISLYLAWQTKLIEIIKTFNPYCQLIIITHAPAIFEEKWQDKVTQMEAIMTRV
jgi:predicted ATPase